jgi:flagellum-specific peptidoglycan hydrolase FlgJ
MKEKKQMSIEQDKKIESSTSYLLIFRNAFKKISKTLLIACMLFFLNVGTKYPTMADAISAVSNTNNTEQMYPIVVRERLHQDLVREVSNYIKLVAPTSKLDAEIVVNLCQKYNMDISFVLGQGVLESRLGTSGKALTTHSVFGVGALDDGTIRAGCIYKNVNESIEPYLILLQKQYLGDKKTAKDLIKDGGFKTLGGSRYATLPAYESRLRTYIVHVEMNTCISMYQDVMNLTDEKILAYFGPIETEINPDSTQMLASLY